MRQDWAVRAWLAVFLGIGAGVWIALLLYVLGIIRN